MEASRHESLAKVLDDCDVGWILDVAENRDQQLQAIAKLITNVSRELEVQLGQTRVDLLSELEADPIVLAPLVRLLPFAVSSGMLAMVYCVLRGMEISTISFSYQQKVAVNLQVSVRASGFGLRTTGSRPSDLKSGV